MLCERQEAKFGAQCANFATEIAALEVSKSSLSNSPHKPLLLSVDLLSHSLNAIAVYLPGFYNQKRKVCALHLALNAV